VRSQLADGRLSHLLADLRGDVHAHS
jgi:hypothetical protein